MINELIDKITVLESYIVSGQKHQDISIPYKFIGNLYPENEKEDIA